MSLDDSYNLVRQFHIALAVPALEKPTLIPPQRAKRRSEWLTEEVGELREASNLVEQADALLDIIYLALGGFVEMGVQPNTLFRIVHESNMSKLGTGGLPKYRSDGKVLKPSDWIDPAPRLAIELDRQLEEARKSD